jgi:hypothetical protein
LFSDAVFAWVDTTATSLGRLIGDETNPRRRHGRIACTRCAGQSMASIPSRVARWRWPAGINGPLRVTTSRSKPPYDGSALRPEADTLNRTVRSLFTPPERSFLEPSPLRASFNPLNYRDSNIRTKTTVVRLRRRKWGERDGKWPEVGLAAAARGSDKWPGTPQFCRVPAADRERKKNVPTGETGGGRGTRVKHSLLRDQ